ncbi:outer membrane beta-barrel protein [Chitinophaga sp. Hz27]|uniref:outer membrane beta-barrel protein n=1 Tax=Chitinophaga sp. Hz27 TaxID=3347169 RepID=UPI0035DCB71E
MKRTLLILTVLFFCSNAQAQFRFGMKAGAGSSYHSKADPQQYVIDYRYSNKFSYYAGITADWQVCNHFSVQPSLLYSSKGSASSFSHIINGTNGFDKFQYAGDVRLNYLELPINLLFKQKLGAGKAFIGTGLYGALYLNGHKNGDFLIREMPDIKTPWADILPATFEGRSGPLHRGGQPDAKLWDTGINFTAGYELPLGLQIALNYNAGFNETYYGKNRVYSVSLSYYLHR